MKKLISKIRKLLRRLTEKAKISLSVSAGVPPFFKIELRYTSEIEKKAVNDNKRRMWRLRAAQKRRRRR